MISYKKKLIKELHFMNEFEIEKDGEKIDEFAINTQLDIILVNILFQDICILANMDRQTFRSFSLYKKDDIRAAKTLNILDWLDERKIKYKIVPNNKLSFFRKIKYYIGIKIMLIRKELNRL